jgi:protoheme IX farnesyltransferase
MTLRVVPPGMGRYLDLCKLRISLLSAFTAGAGYAIVARQSPWGGIALTAGVFLTACGASGLNQYQERDIDALMPRTSGRPLPAGKIMPLDALSFSYILIGLFAFLWYNGLYTFLKRKSGLAVVPGAITGSVPPAIGWAGGGGSLLDHRLAALCFFLFMWQIPHFWLLTLRYGKEYEEAGLPSPRDLFSERQMTRISFVWTMWAALSSLLVIMHHIVSSPAVTLLLLASASWIVWNCASLVRGGGVNDGSLFRKINYHMAFTLGLPVIERFPLISVVKEVFASLK